MTRTETALRYFDDGCDCGKALLRAYEPILVLSDKTRARYRSACSGLPGSPAERCELVSGAFEVLEHLHAAGVGASPSELEARFERVFGAGHSSTRCRDLLGYDLSDVRGLSQAIDNNAVNGICRNLMAQTCSILDQIISENP